MENKAMMNIEKKIAEIRHLKAKTVLPRANHLHKQLKAMKANLDDLMEKIGVESERGKALMCKFEADLKT